MSCCWCCALLYLLWSLWICSCGCLLCYCWSWWHEVRFDFEPCFSCPWLSIQISSCLCWLETVQLLLKVLCSSISPLCYCSPVVFKLVQWNWTFVCQVCMLLVVASCVVSQENLGCCKSKCRCCVSPTWLLLESS